MIADGLIVTSKYLAEPPPYGGSPLPRWILTYHLPGAVDADWKRIADWKAGAEDRSKAAIDSMAAAFSKL